MKNKFLAIAALSGLFCVGFGAVASHALTLNKTGQFWIDTGLKYQMFHTLALMALGLFQIANSQQNPPACRAKAFNIIGGAWSLGILLFSGSLYAMALEIGRIPMLTPIGGLCFILGWVVLAYISVRSRKNVQ